MRDRSGNIRELEHAIHRAVIRAMSDGENHSADSIIQLKPQHLDIEPVSIATAAEPASLLMATSLTATSTSNNISMKDAVDIYQKQLIELSLESNLYNWAKSLKIHSSNLHRLARRLGIFQADN